MSEGTIKKITEKGFGFIEDGTGTDMFFHSTSVEGVSFEELREGQRSRTTSRRDERVASRESVRLI